MSRERALTAAVALVDAEGLKALTMRRLAAELGVEAMSLYYHLPGKQGLLDGLAESVIGEIAAAVGDDEREWRDRLRHRFLRAREVMLRHPWAPAVLGSRPAVPPSLYAYYDQIVGTLLAAGFTPNLAHRALHAFGTMALGFVQELFTPAATDVDAAEDDLAAMAETVPHLTAMVAAEIHAAGDPTLGWCDSQTEFEFTLDLLLDGLDRARAAQAGRRSPATD
ncbi:TetR/AcrR family transcriptional regulator C-terminal domain-containing protein [Actinoplanes sp. KI2]|uniref:TetR/AcrR family transcriptional regulator C-terminal domain-containing protein n=1 Tax=Actinoplanes sp. KI2 TaxID=2983315 RepID=UPI0021D5C45D|nr:TetR/AcrR family transcriptional regulator C-terminal domain-containing protein [Actinoplanes sp. KI2]MCU7727076.1 TetR/AcrR family transcriptional regulator C-terminal domain-containing protein [Actinoplanes sp. KI2]